MTNPHGESYYNGNPFKGVHITIVGVGAVGSWLAISLAKQGALLTLVDFDTVDRRNLGATAFYEADLGQRKVDVLQNVLYTQVERVRTWRLTTTNIRGAVNSRTSLMIDCTDNAETRNVIQRYAPTNCLHVGINAHYGSAVWAIDFTDAIDPEGDPSCEVPYSLNLIMPLVGLTVDMLAKYYNTGIKESIDFNLVTGRKSILATH